MIHSEEIRPKEYRKKGNSMSIQEQNTMSAADALEILREGNRRFCTTEQYDGDIGFLKRNKTAQNGQHPYAIIISCSDSRVIPECIFQAGIGDLFVIRVAGNVMDDHQLGSIEYAASHLGVKLIVVLGHEGCGAIEAAIHHDPEGYIKFITDEISTAIGDEQDPAKACCLNVRHSIQIIENSFEIHKEEEHGLQVVGAIYHLKNGQVEFI